MKKDRDKLLPFYAVVILLAQTVAVCISALMYLYPDLFSLAF